MNKQLREELGLFLTVTPLRVADTDPYASDFKVVAGVHDSPIASVTNYGAGSTIREETRDEDTEYQDASIREGLAFTRLFAASPEMYESLQRFVNGAPSGYCHCASKFPEMADKSPCEYCMGRAALAKARGESTP